MPRLLEEVVFDHVKPNVPNVVKELCMAYMAALSQQLLVRIQSLRCCVCFSFSSIQARMYRRAPFAPRGYRVYEVWSFGIEGLP